MKKISLLLFMIILSQPIFSQGNRDIESLSYIRLENYTSQVIKIGNINDFIKLINDNNVTTIFFNEELFLIQGTSTAYIINTNGYKNVNDYKNGNNKNFKDGDSYYFAIENRLPNQIEVDYYRQEGFITNSDYHEATRLGFTHSNVEKNGIYGLITKEDMQKNIKYLNTIYYLKTYKNWQTYKDQLTSRDRTVRQQKEKEELAFLENTDIDLIISRFGNNQIKKMKNFNYYFVNIPLDSEKDSIFYYACKFCQYTDINDYKKNNSKLTIKGTERILQQFSFNSIEAFLAGDAVNATNGNDYNLMVNYGNITLEQLNQNRAFINELESIKQKYLNNIDMTKLSDDKRIISFAIYSMLKMQKGIPVSSTLFINNVKKEYGTITIYDKISFNPYTVSMIFENIPQIKNMFVINYDNINNSYIFYLK
jgi:hypothetical protein